MEIALEGDGAPPDGRGHVRVRLSPQDQEDLRWYLEDFLQYPRTRPRRSRAGSRGGWPRSGTELFQAVFQANDDARDLWATLRDRLPETRIEIVTGVAEAAAIPWELLRDPKTDVPLALRPRPSCAPSRTRRSSPQLPATEERADPHPAGHLPAAARGDVPFRSVASRLIKGLSEAKREAFELDVLRPPTFEQLGQVLREANREGKPYHVVHFDGHGVYWRSRSPGRSGLSGGRC